MDAQNISFVLALSAGLLSFASPCVLPLVPAYIGYLSGSTIAQQGEASDRRAFLHAFGFVLGFSTVFVLLGASVGAMGHLLYNFLPLLRRVGGAILVVFGLHTMGVLKVPPLYRERRLTNLLPIIEGRSPTTRREKVRHLGLRVSPRLSYLASFLMGVFFAAGWVPCVGPILSAILLLASDSQSMVQGTYLLVAYSLGLGLPFLLTGLAFSTVSGYLRRLNRYLNIVSILSGVFLIALGVAIFTDSLRFLAR